MALLISLAFAGVVSAQAPSPSTTAGAASTGGAGAAGAAGATGAAGAGGGISATTIAIVGGAVAGGAVVAQQTGAIGGGQVTYTGSLSGQYVWTNHRQRIDHDSGDVAAIATPRI